MTENFDFLAFVQGRNYPTDSVTIYFDEASAYALQREENEAKIAELQERVRASAVTINLTGISEMLQERILDKAVEKFPRAFRTERNFITGMTEKIELTAADDNPNAKARDRWYTNLYYAAHITGIEKDGAVDSSPITLESLEDDEYLTAVSNKIDALRKSAPKGQIVKFYEAVKALTVQAEAYEKTITEDF